MGWIDDPGNDPDDLRLHGDAIAYIGDRKLEYDKCTVSATALYLLKTLTEDPSPINGWAFRTIQTALQFTTHGEIPELF